MTRILRPIAIAVIAIAAASAGFAADTTRPAKADPVKWEKAEKNYISALHSGNVGAQISAARLLADYRLKGSVKDLKALLQHDPSENVRISAALALIMLDDKEGREAVQEASLYDGSDRVAEFCEALLNAHPIAAASIAGE
jgi:hypothetical protein